MGAQTRHPGGDVAGPEEPVTTRQLLDAVRGRSRRVDSVDAVHELARRRPRQWTEVLGEVVQASDRPDEVRAAVAVELGREDSRANAAALERALDAGPTVVRRAAEALGRIGDAAAMERLSSLRSTSGPAARSVEFARTLIAYRLGLGQPLLESPGRGEVVEADPDRARPVDVTHVPLRDAEAVREQVHDDVPAIPLSRDGAMALDCDGRRRFLVMFTEQAHRGRALEALLDTPGVLAAVFEWSESLERHDLAEYVLTDPDRDGRLRLFGVRPTGAVVHAGDVLVEAATARVTVRGLDRPHSVPVTLDATIDRSTGEVTVERALADPDAPARRGTSLPLSDPE